MICDIYVYLLLVELSYAIQKPIMQAQNTRKTYIHIFMPLFKAAEIINIGRGI